MEHSIHIFLKAIKEKKHFKANQQEQEKANKYLDTVKCKYIIIQWS